MSSLNATDSVQNHSLYHVTPSSNGRLVTSGGEVFDLTKYSRFKHGSGYDADDYGTALGKSLVKAHPELFNGKLEIVVAAAPYRTIPKGAQGIADALTRYLNTHVLKGLPQAKSVKITAVNPPADTDYSSLTEAQRVIRNNRVQFQINPEDFRDKYILVVDDTRITGGTESKIIRLLGQLELPLSSVLMLYVANLDPAKAKEDPTIEDRMNTAYVKTLAQQLEIINAGHFLLNPRVIQFILNPKNIADLRDFAMSIEVEMLLNIVQSLVRDGYHIQDKYIRSYETLEEVVRLRTQEMEFTHG